MSICSAVDLHVHFATKIKVEKVEGDVTTWLRIAVDGPDGPLTEISIHAKHTGGEVAALPIELGEGVETKPLAKEGEN